MKAITPNTVAALALSFTLAACVPSVEERAPAPIAAPAPAPAPTPTPTPAPPPPPPPVVEEPAYENYLDAPPTPGTWTYVDESGESLALFGIRATEPVLIIRCGKSTREVGIARVLESDAVSPRAMRIRTETRDQQLVANPIGSTRPLVAAEVSANDTILDAMAITKGRFAVETEGLPTLYVPAWVEVSRVIEDCR